MKKVAAMLLCLFLFSILAACSDDSGSAEGDDKITLWYWNRGLDEKVLEKVKEEFPDVEFVAQKLPPGGDYKTKLTTLLASNNNEDAPDMVLMNIWISEFLPYADKFVNIYDHGGAELEDKFPDWKLSQAITGDGEKMIAIPVDTSPTGFFYRKDVFSKAGIAESPEELQEKISTWDGYVNVLTTLKNEANAYAVSSIKDAFGNQVNKLDKRYFDKDNNFIGDQEHIKEVWDKAIELGEKGLVLGNVDEFSEEWNAALINNEIVGYDGPVWAKDLIIDTASSTSGKWRVTRSPIADGNDGGSFLAVLSSTDQPEKSVEIAKFINSPENQITSYKNMSLFPSAIEALESDEINHKEEFFGGQNTTEVFAESAKNVKKAYKGPQESIVLTAFRNELELVYTQDKDPEKAWEDALSKIERDLSM
ncbi:ABC transporter substrate-binding protein [Virgibacillus necropolis]|uniref:Sugar ABC transporter substrate-binding protein n=1 Tax=Virgibacillus necropolis TaxID=163877 RepID=A0A221M957_9BACI|nr:ABC transporter substrate-binding protein [Virgibacillus necropolis]ASN04162.1 sugar ABC transporter substrate-binding protein [Virgibacillus necropolis]